jgi:hypothetical protein
VKRHPTNILRNRARAKESALELQRRNAEIARVVEAVESGKVNAPPSVLEALKKLLPAQSPNTGEDDVAESKHSVTPQGTSGSVVDILARFVQAEDQDECIGAACCIAFCVRTYRAPLGFCVGDRDSYAASG